MPQSWNKMRQSNRQPQLHMKRFFYRLDKEQEVLDLTRETEQNRLWSELYHHKQEYQKGLRRKFTEEQFFDPGVQIYPPRSNRFKGSDEEMPLSQVYREFLIFKTKKTLQLFGDRKPVRPRYSELYEKADAPKFNNERSVTLLLDRGRPPTPDSKVKQLALVIPGRKPKIDASKDDEDEEETTLHLPIINTDRSLGFGEVIDTKLQSQSERSPLKPRFVISGRQSVSRESVRRENPAVTSSGDLPAGTSSGEFQAGNPSGVFPPAVSASNVKLDGFNEQKDKNDNNDNVYADLDMLRTNKTFITQPMDKLPPIAKINRQKEEDEAEKLDVPDSRI